MAVQQRIITDMGGRENLSTAKLVLIELIGRDIYVLDETDRRIIRVIRWENEQLKQQR